MPSTGAENQLPSRRPAANDNLLDDIRRKLSVPIFILSLIFLALFIVEVAVKLSPEWSRAIGLIQSIIWIIFAIDYLIELAIADNKIEYLKSNILMTLALVLPFLRIFQVLRVLRATRALGALQGTAVAKRALHRVSASFRHNRLSYFLAFAGLVTFFGAAGIYYIERNAVGTNIITFGDALWWSAGITTTVGTELYPVTAEGRILAVILMIFGVSFFGYVAGLLAGFFVNLDRDIERNVKRSKDGG